MVQNKKRVIGFVKNVIFSLFSSILPIAVLQLFVFPRIATIVDSETNGLILSLVALLTLVSEPLGYALNNSRLLMNKEYEDKGLTGDFNILLLLSIPINVLAIILSTVFYTKEHDISVICLMVLSSTIILAHKYYMVYFRLQLDYLRIFISNFLLCLGYIIGLYLFAHSCSWLFIYIIGGALSLIYTFYKNPLLKEKIRFTNLIKKTIGKIGALLFVESSNSVIKYADRLLLYPLLGGTAVSIYYSATVISKLISLAISPISTVILSYFSRMDSFRKKHFVYMTIITGIAGLAGYFICVVIALPVLNYLYPEWAEESFKLVYVTTATAVVDAVNSVIRPAVLKFRSTKWQYWIGTTNATLYILLSLLCFKFGGLMGFCVGLLLNSCIQFVFRSVVFLRHEDKINEELH